MVFNRHALLFLQPYLYIIMVFNRHTGIIIIIIIDGVFNPFLTESNNTSCTTT